MGTSSLGVISIVGGCLLAQVELVTARLVSNCGEPHIYQMHFKSAPLWLVREPRPQYQPRFSVVAGWLSLLTIASSVMKSLEHFRKCECRENDM